MPNVQTSPQEYDVCIVGSGAGGGMAAYVLAKAGVNVVILEAGQQWTAEDDGAMFTWNYESPRRGASTKKRPFGEFDGCIGGWEIEGEPYTTAPGTQWRWWRARMLGGRTNHWGRISLRFGPEDFNGKSADGYGDDWPIGYEDVKPYYDRLDRLVGVFGTNEGLYNEPDGLFLPPPEPRCYELKFKEGCKKVGVPIIPSRLSILTESLNGRPACHYCAQCNRGCATHSNFSSGPVLIEPAMETGRVKLITNAMVREVTTNDEGRATGVSYIDTESRREYKVKARAVVLAASACESARLLLNSKSPRHPNGLANSSGLVGRYLMDSTGTSVGGIVPELMNTPAHNCDGVGGMHMYVPWWGYGENLDFPRGYHFELWGGRGMPGYGFKGGIHNYNGLYPYSGSGEPQGNTADSTSIGGPDLQSRERVARGGGYGKALKEDYRRFYGSTVGLSGRGEMLARKENYCAVDPNVVDKYGIPVLRFHVTFGEEEYLQVKHMQEKGREIIRAMGGEPFGEMPTEEEGYGILPPGLIIHESGVTRMGNDPKTSVLNEYCQAHDVDNLFVADGAPFVSMPHKNITWTILALSMRTSEYVAEQGKKGNL